MLLVFRYGQRSETGRSKSFRGRIREAGRGHSGRGSAKGPKAAGQRADECGDERELCLCGSSEWTQLVRGQRRRR